MLLLIRRGFRAQLGGFYGGFRPFHFLPTRCLCNSVTEQAAARLDVNGGEQTIDIETKHVQYDVAIVGGGMVGLALACALSRFPLTKHLNLAIIDPNPALGSKSYLKKDEVPDSRVSTITPVTISFFKDIGAWEHIKQQRHAFFDHMQVWDYTGLGYTRYNAKDVGKDCLGCVVENKVLCNSLLLSLLESDSQKAIIPAKLNSMTMPSSSAKVTSFDNSLQQKHLSHLAKLELNNGQTLYSKLVVGADGGKSLVREIAGIKTTGWNYSQSGLICTVEHNMENRCAWQRFLPSGPLALLPIGCNYSNIVWTMNQNDAERYKTMSEEDFVEAVNHAMNHGYGPHPQSSSLEQYLERFQFINGLAPSTRESFEVPPTVTRVVSQRMAFPLSLMHAHDYVAKRVALIGDAAHTVHPLAGQGVNLGFGDAYTLAKVISDGLSVGSDVGELALLKKYEKERKAANVTMMAILDGIQKAYSVDLGPLNALRAAAFHGAQFIAPLKKSIISYAMGEKKLPLFS